MTHHLRRAVPSISRSPVSGPHAPALTTTFGRGLDGLGVLPATGSTTMPGSFERLLRQRGSGGSRRGAPQRRAGWGAVWSPQSACAGKNCWAKLLTASPKKALGNCTFFWSMSVRHSQRWCSWTTTSHNPETDSPLSLEAWGPLQHAVHVKPPGCDHPRAGLSVLWPGRPAVTPWCGGQKPPPHRLYKHCQLDLTITNRPVRGDTDHPAEW